MFAHEILNANPYAFLDDAPLEERRARAVTLRRGLPAAVADDSGRLDPEAIAAVVEEARPDLRDADELHDLLLELGALPEPEAARLDRLSRGADRRPARRAPARRGRASSGSRPSAARSRRRSGRPPASSPTWPSLPLAAPPPGPIARARWSSWCARGSALVGPTTAAGPGRGPRGLRRRGGRGAGRVEAEGGVLRGRFTPAAAAREAVEWCDRRLLARIHRRTLDGLRREIEPVTAAALMRFLLSLAARARRGRSCTGATGSLRVIEQLEGFEAAARRVGARGAAGARGALRARLARRAVPLGRGRSGAASAASELAARGPPALGHGADARSCAARSAWLLEPRDGAPDERALPAPRATCSPTCARAGASFIDDIAARVRRPARSRWRRRSASWSRPASSPATASPACARCCSRRSAGASAPAARRPLRAAPSAPGAGRCSARRRGARRRTTCRGPARQLRAALRRRLPRSPAARARRAGLARSPARLPPPRDARRAARRPHRRRLRRRAVRRARGARRAARRPPRAGRRGEVVRLSACDPLNLVGIITPGAARARDARPLGHLPRRRAAHRGVPRRAHERVRPSRRPRPGSRGRSPLALTLGSPSCPH